MAEVRDLTPLRDETGEIVGFPTVERQLTACLDGLRRAQSQRRSRRPLEHNRVFLYAWPSHRACRCPRWPTFARTVAPLTVGAGLEEIVLLARLQERGRRRRARWRCASPTGRAPACACSVTDRPTEPMRPLDEYTEKVLQLARPRRRLPVRAGARCWPGPTARSSSTTWTSSGRLVPVERPPGHNRAGIVVGVVEHADRRATPRA